MRQKSLQLFMGIAWLRHLLAGSITFALICCVAIVFAQSSTGEVAKSATEAKALKVGAMAPDADLKDLDGKPVKLKSLISGKPTAVIFYRGGWCPYCNVHLSELVDVEAQLRAEGFQLLALSPDTPGELKKTMVNEKVTYRLLSDSSAVAMKRFGIAFRVDDDTYSMYRDRFKIDLEKSSGEKHHILPVPSVFLIDKNGKITFVYSNADYKVRLNGSELLKAARATKS